MKPKSESNLISLFEKWNGNPVENIQLLAQSGSVRQYYRISNKEKTVIGCYNDNKKENKAFIEFSKHFYKKLLPVPIIYAEDLNNGIYLQEDLGDITLFYEVEKQRDTGLCARLIRYYKKAINQLIIFQTEGGEGLNYSFAYPRDSFDKQSMLWDLNYFKHYFVKLAGVVFDEQYLEDDFNELTNYLLSAENQYFMYRDFQSRNIMVKDEDLFFIDYQGGRKGPLQYDLASLLYDAKADLSPIVRKEFLEYYIETVSKKVFINEQKFTEQYYCFVLIRIMQAFGAYGYRGIFERKQHFLLSIPFALKNLEWVLSNSVIPVKIPELRKIFDQLITSTTLKELNYKPKAGLTISINSFSYKKSIPVDNSGNGGGFVFDCRFLPNPGRLEGYKDKDGLHPLVIEYLSGFKEVNEFLEHVKSICSTAITNYLSRKFSHLMISFGCTGGQHRSVYCADQLAEYLKNNEKINVEIRHIEQEAKQLKAS